MGRPRKNNSKLHKFDNFMVNVGSYKRKVAIFEIRFDFERDEDDDSRKDISSLLERTKKMYEDEFSYIRRTRHILDTDMTDLMRGTTAHCSLRGYFLSFDGYEEYVVEHSKSLMEKLVTMFEENDLKIIRPNKYKRYVQSN